MPIGDANARLLLAVTTIAFGNFLRRIGLVDVDVGKSLLKVLFNATLPSVLLMSIFNISPFAARVVHPRNLRCLPALALASTLAPSAIH